METGHPQIERRVGAYRTAEPQAKANHARSGDRTASILQRAIIPTIPLAAFSMASRPGPWPWFQSILNSIFQHAGGSSAFHHLCLAVNQLLGGLL